MNTLLLFFALPIATIIISIALQKIFRCPFLVAAIIFAIFLVVTFAVGDIATYLVATIAYTILSFITAVITSIICKIINQLDERENCRRRCGCTNSNNNGTQVLSINGNNRNTDDLNLLTISSNNINGDENDLLTISSNGSVNNNGTTNCNCNTANNAIAVRANVFPNNTNGTTGSFSGCYRRR